MRLIKQKGNTALRQMQKERRNIMKKIKKLTAMLIALMMMLALSAPAAMADPLYGVITTPTSNGSVNLRAKAGVTQAIIGWAQNGDEVEIVYVGNTWHRVKLLKNGRVGWVYGRYLKIAENVTEPESTTGAALSGVVAQVMTKYPSSTVNLRMGAGSEYPVIDKCVRGTRLEIIDESGNWYQVRVAGTETEGWMSKNYISLGLSARTTGRVNLRRGPGTGYTVIRTLANGQDVTVTWVGDGWSKVEIGEESGYISNTYYVFR